MTGYESKRAAAQDKLAQPAQEPWPEEPFGHMAGGVQPPQRPWVDLTDEDIALIDWESLITKKDCVRAIEQLSKELNA